MTSARHWLSTEEAADYLGLPVPTVQNLAETKRITSYVMAKRRRFTKEDLDVYIEDSKILAEPIVKQFEALLAEPNVMNQLQIALANFAKK